MLSGAMFKRDVDNWVSWVNENLPMVAMSGDAKVRRIVKRALNDLEGVRFVITFCGTFIGALIGHFLVSLYFEPPYPEWQHVLFIVGSGTILTIVTGKYCDSLLVRKIETLASRS
jgi:hypothetical protein